MKRNNIKAIAFDMDGTLLTDSKEISSRTRTCFKALEERGVSLILSTGRSYEALEPYKKDLNLDHPVICYNGAQIFGQRGEVIRDHLVPDTHSKYLIDFARKEGVHLQIYRDGKLYFEARTPEAEFYENHVSLKGEIVNFDNFKPLKFTKLMYLGDHQYLAGLSSQLEEHFKKDMAIMFSNPMFLEFIDGSVSKGHALIELAENLGIETDNIMAFGDGENDISMIQTAAIGVAMENAAPDVKAVSDKITLSNNDDGVAEFLEEFFEL
ncbi:MAG: Cof-type HAD-IIB family hydrolase [Spirochaetota bacterium]|nr:Cof-type HAD-IIB family hydrolase [Spirochaetota bacterium]